MKRWFFIAAVALLLPIAAQAAPITLKELSFLVRQRTPEAEIIAEAQKRRLLAALTADDAQALRQSGASEGLIKALSAPGLTISAEEAAAEKQRQAALQAQTAQSMAEDAAAHEALERFRRQVAGVNATRGKTADQLEGKLVRLNGDQFAAVSGRDLANVRVFGLYYSAMWCGPCRQFTPTLVREYQRLKARYGDQFELIFVSVDKDEFNMREYMRSDQMPWPAVRYGFVNPFLQRYAGKSIPWLVAVNSAGEPMTANGVNGTYIEPTKILGAIEQLLATGKR